MSNVSMIDGHIDKMTNYERIKSMSIDAWNTRNGRTENG